MACIHDTVMKFTSCQIRLLNNGQNLTRIDGEMGSQCTITCLLWQSNDVRMHKTPQISELRFVHRKLTRIGGYLGTSQTPMKSQGILLEGAVLIERFLRNPYANAPQDCGCPAGAEPEGRGSNTIARAYTYGPSTRRWRRGRFRSASVLSHDQRDASPVTCTSAHYACRCTYIIRGNGHGGIPWPPWARVKNAGRFIRTHRRLILWGVGRPRSRLSSLSKTWFRAALLSGSYRDGSMGAN